MKCDWCGTDFPSENRWLAKRIRINILFDPDGNEREDKAEEPMLAFCTKSHRNEFLYGI